MLARNFAATTQEDMISGMQAGRIAMVYFPFGRTTLFNDPAKSKFAGSFKTLLSPISEDRPEVEGAGHHRVLADGDPQEQQDQGARLELHPRGVDQGQHHQGRDQRQRPGAQLDLRRPDDQGEAALRRAGGRGDQDRSVPLPPFDGSAQARDIFIEEMQLCVLGRQTPEETGKNIVARVNPLLPKI